jgi:hypothetical protein
MQQRRYWARATSSLRNLSDAAMNITHCTWPSHGAATRSGRYPLSTQRILMARFSRLLDIRLTKRTPDAIAWLLNKASAFRVFRKEKGLFRPKLCTGSGGNPVRYWLTCSFDWTPDFEFVITKAWQKPYGYKVASYKQPI